MTEAQRLEAWERTSKIVYQVVPAIAGVARRHGSCAAQWGHFPGSRPLGGVSWPQRDSRTDDPGVNQVELVRDQLDDLAKQLAPMSMSDRLALPGMNRRRAAVLPVGATILAADRGRPRRRQVCGE